MRPQRAADAAGELPPELAELAADFVVEREVGRGGTAVVYLARDRTLERRVAIKVIRGRYATDDELVARMDREARLAARLHHPNIVGLHAVRRLRHGSLALIMQYVDGETVRQLLARGPVPAARAAQLVGDIARALAVAHAAGVVHRDVKPENIYVEAAGADGEGRALLADFGAAIPLDADARLTVAGMTIGTPGYLAPELVAGGDATPRSDIYSLGLVGWELLTGWQPWEGESLFEVLAFRKSGRLPRIDDVLPEVPPALATAINGALHLDPDERWPDADSMLRALQLRGVRTAPHGPRATGDRPRETPAPSRPIAEQPTVRWAPAAPADGAAATAAPAPAPDAMPDWLVALGPSAARRAWNAVRRRPRVVAAVAGAAVVLAVTVAAAVRLPWPVAVPVTTPAAARVPAATAAAVARRPATAAADSRWRLPAWLPFAGEAPPLHTLPPAQQLERKVPHPPALVAVWQHGDGRPGDGDARSLVLAADGRAWLVEERREVDDALGPRLRRETRAGRWEVRHAFGRAPELCTIWSTPQRAESCGDVTVAAASPTRRPVLGFAGRHWRAHVR